MSILGLPCPSEGILMEILFFYFLVWEYKKIREFTLLQTLYH